MGFLDKIKQQATDVATTVVEKTQETAKSGQAQLQLRSLKGEEKEALADLGAAMIALGEAPPSLSDQITRVHDIRDKIAAKEQEIADAREEDEPAAAAPGDTVEGEAEEVVDTPPPAEQQPEAAAAADSDETPA
jgi:predicted  nucleic acid-binding Zn-ribbon protein